MELVRLADEPRVNANALRDCVAQDPALTCKILRVDNSSLFGLNRPVADLNQAIGLLGIKPLKLLVLGFNLPDALFAEVAARELRWYWTNTLTRAVAARMLAEQLWNKLGDEAFIAGLLQDIGILVLLRELGAPYARFLTGVIDEKCHLASLEQDTLGFDHIQLSAALLSRWQLPQRLAEAIAMPKRRAKLARMTSPEADLPQILHLAELLMQLVGQGRLGVLGDLLEAGRQYRGMTKAKLATLVKDLQPQVDQLGQALSLELTAERDYAATLLEAHRQMSALSEQIAGGSPSRIAEDQAYAQLLTHTHELSSAMQSFLGGSGKAKKEAPDEAMTHDHASRGSAGANRVSVTNAVGESTAVALLAKKLVASATRCRDRRQELSLLIVEPNVDDIHSDPRSELASNQVRRALTTICAQLDDDEVIHVSLSRRRTAMILSNCERRSAVDVGQRVISELGKIAAAHPESDSDLATTVSIGVATASVVPKNFDPMRMIESAERCLSTARGCGISAVKSIEV
jgi:HD-like signal output (HDOD) protein